MWRSSPVSFVCVVEMLEMEMETHGRQEIRADICGKYMWWDICGKDLMMQKSASL